jgi:hypothetical protein
MSSSWVLAGRAATRRDPREAENTTVPDRGAPGRRLTSQERPRGASRHNGVMTALWLTGDAETDRLLDEDPFALLIGMLLDQHML